MDFLHNLVLFPTASGIFATLIAEAVLLSLTNLNLWIAKVFAFGEIGIITGRVIDALALKQGETQRKITKAEAHEIIDSTEKVIESVFSRWLN